MPTVVGVDAVAMVVVVAVMLAVGIGVGVVVTLTMAVAVVENALESRCTYLASHQNHLPFVHLGPMFACV